MTAGDAIRTLVILTPGFPADEQDSTCLPSQQAFVRALNKTFPEITVVILTFHYPAHQQEYHWNGNRVIPFNGSRFGRMLRPVLWKNVLFKLSFLMKTSPAPGILSLWYTETALLGHWLTRRYRHPHYCWILGQDATKSNHYVQWTKVPASALIAISDATVAEFRRNHGLTPAHVICNGIDPDEFPSPVEKDIEILGAGSLIPLKRYDMLIEAVAALRVTLPAIRAVICGTGSEEKKLKELVRKKDLINNVTLTGEITHRDVLLHMRRAKILLHPSAYEGYSASCLEALYAGCHVVSFTTPENAPIEHWHSATGLQHALGICKKLLIEETDFAPVLRHSMADTATRLVRLYSVG